MTDERVVAVSRITNEWLALAMVGAGFYDAFARREGARRIASLAGACVAAAAASTVRVVSNAKGLEVGFGPWGFPRKKIAIAEIAAARSEQIEALRFGGWGYRFRGRNTRVVVKSGPGVVVDLVGGGTFGVTVPDADAHVRALGLPEFA